MQFELLPPVPAVVLADKLRQIPLFSFVGVDELFRISSIARQVRHEEGRTIQEEGAPVEYIQVLVEGKIRVSGKRREEEEVGPPALLGFREVLEGAPLRETAHAVETSICLAIASEEFRVLLSDNIELAQGLFRMLLSAPSENGRPSLRQRAVHPEERSLVTGGSEGLKPIEKVLLLQELPVFSRTTAEELLALTAIAQEFPLVKDERIFSEGDQPAIHIILSGELSVEPPEGTVGGALVVTAGDALGLNETLAGTPFGWRGNVVREGLALRIERERLFEVLADHADLLQGLFSSLFQSEPGANT
ncbi:MAG: cyclic nucleotide-binding domain-containing protein [Vicinamibacteria bacterium]